MRYEDFIDQVEQRMGVASPEQAIAATKAVLETLGERVDRKVWNGIASQLPGELREFLLARARDTDRYHLAEFYNRVGARADLNYDDAHEHTRQVLSVLRQAISGGEWQNLVASLPDDEYGELFGQEAAGSSRPAGNP